MSGGRGADRVRHGVGDCGAHAGGPGLPSAFHTEGIRRRGGRRNRISFGPPATRISC